MELEERVKELREKQKEQLDSKKKAESIEQTRKRMKNVLRDRDEAMQSIYDYQDKTGIPAENETEKNFFEIETRQKD